MPFATSSSGPPAYSCFAAWLAYDGFKHPESRSKDLLHAVLILLFGALAWVRRLTRGALVIKPRWSWGGDLVNHWTAALLPLLVVVAFGLVQLIEARQEAAQKDRASKKQEWQKAVQRQREVSHLASEQLTAASVKQGEAFRVSIETGEKLKLADGTPGFRMTPDATRKLEEAKEGFNRALEQDKAERDAPLSARV